MRGAEHVVLLGDSIFDNAAYTRGEPDVLAYLRAALPSEWRASSCAVDGATTSTLGRQLAAVPADASRLVVAIGGNDALQNLDLLDLRASSGAEVLAAFDARLAIFDRAYRAALRQVMDLSRPVTVCTIYNGALPGEAARLAAVGLRMFNDTILRTAVEWGLGAIELRAVCTDSADYANPIEPSRHGGSKIARAVARALGA